MSTATGAAPTVTVEDRHDPACDAFCETQPLASVCHSFRWSEMISRAFGHRVYYLVAREAGEVRAVLPLTHVRSWLFGNMLVSQGFANYGGPVAADRPALDAVYAQAVALAEKLGCENLELRNIEPLPYELQNRTDKICMRLQLMNDPDALWASFKSDTKVRNHIRKGEKAGITTQIGGLELLDEFYGLYTIRMHQLGSPCYGRQLMKSILETFPETSRIFIARLGGETVAVRLTVAFNGWVESIWGVTRIEQNNLSPNHVLYWAALKHYCLAGAKWFDFGRSTTGSGPYLFKKQWGAEPVQLNYQYWVRPGHTMNVLSPDNPKYKRRVDWWKRMPLSLTRVIGPRLSASLP